MPPMTNRNPTDTGALSVLIADDAALVRHRLVRLVSAVPGVGRVHESEDCQGTVDSVKRHRPDVVLLDLSMPGGSGLDVLALLAAEPVRPRVIVLTADPDIAIGERCLAAGAEQYFDKAGGFLDAIGSIAQMAGAVEGRGHV